MNDPLGYDEKLYHKELRKLIPHLNSLSNDEYKKKVKIFCKGIGIDKPEADSDIDAIFDVLVRRVGGKFKEEKKIQAAYIDVSNKPKKCPECGSKSLVRDYGKAEIFCADCGLVIAENLLSGGEELRCVPTSVGLLKDDVKSLYKSLSRAGFIRHGKVRNREEVILFLIMLRMFHYGCAESLKGGFSIKDKRKAREGYIRVFKKFGIKIPTYTFDLYEMIIFDVDFLIPNWAASFKISNELLAKSKYEDVRREISRVILGGWLIKGKEIHKKLKEQAREQAEKDIKTGKRPTPYPYNWITLLCVIYGIRCLEKKKGDEALFPDPILQRIWGIPRKTWKDKWQLISSMDKDL